MRYNIIHYIRQTQVVKVNQTLNKNLKKLKTASVFPCLEYGWACSDFLKRSLTISLSRSLGSRLLFSEERYVRYFYLSLTISILLTALMENILEIINSIKR